MLQSLGEVNFSAVDEIYSLSNFVTSFEKNSVDVVFLKKNGVSGGFYSSVTNRVYFDVSDVVYGGLVVQTNDTLTSQIYPSILLNYTLANCLNSNCTFQISSQDSTDSSISVEFPVQISSKFYGKMAFKLVDFTAQPNEETVLQGNELAINVQDKTLAVKILRPNLPNIWSLTLTTEPYTIRSSDMYKNLDTNTIQWDYPKQREVPKVITEGVGIAVNIVFTAAAPLLLSPLLPSTSFSLMQTLSSFSYLLLLNGNIHKEPAQLVKTLQPPPSSTIHSALLSLLPSPQCRYPLPSQLSILSLSCSIIYSIPVDILTMIGVGVIGGIVSVVREWRPMWSNRRGGWLLRMYGIDWAGSYVYAGQGRLGVLGGCDTVTSTFWMSNVLSYLFMIGFAALNGWLLWSASVAKRDKKIGTFLERMLPKGKIEGIGLYAPGITGMKTILASAFVGTTSTIRLSTLQLFPVLIIELAYLAYLLLITSTHPRKPDHFSTIICQLFTILYIIVKCIDQLFALKEAGRILYWLLLLNLLQGIVYMIVKIVALVVGLVFFRKKARSELRQVPGTSAFECASLESKRATHPEPGVETSSINMDLSTSRIS